MVSIVVASLDGSLSVDACLCSIRDFTPEKHEVIVVDVPRLSGDWAVAKTMNRGAQDAKGDYLVFLTADTVVTPSWLSSLLTCAFETGAGAVGPMCNLLVGHQNLVPTPSSRSDIQSFARAHNRTDASKWHQVAGIACTPMLVSRRLFEDLGGFDTRFGSGAFVGDDLCLRIARSGGKVFIAGDTYLHLQGPRHVLQSEPEQAKVMDWEARRMCAKWNLDDPLAAQPRQDIVEAADVNGKSVLDLKCRAGATLLECGSKGASSLVGFEDDRTMRSIVAASCSGRDDVTILSGERALRPKRTFDVVLAVWQLERLTNPVAALRRYKTLLSPNGIMLAVVRNSWSISRVLPLLLTAPPPTYPRPAWGPSAAPDDVLRWFKDTGFSVTAVKTAYAPPQDQDAFLESFFRLARKHGFLEEPKREQYSDECWVTATLRCD